jgi:hypothetical protein
VPWSLFLLGDAAALRHSGNGWLLGEVSSSAVIGWLVTLAGLTGLALFKAGAWCRGDWLPKRLRAGMIAVALLWVLSLSVDFYTLDGETYGSMFNTGSTTANIWYLLASLSIVALIFAGLRFLAPHVGSWLIVTAAATPLVLLIAELAYLIDDYEDPDAGLLWLMVVPTLALFGLSVTALVRSRRDVAEDRTEAVGEAAAT